MNASSTKRLLIASLVAIVVTGVLSFASGYIPGASTTAVGAFGHMDPLSSLATAIGMCMGGYLGGKRFIAVAVGLMLVTWIATLVVVVQVAEPGRPLPLADVLAFHRSQILFSLLAATAGASIGAWLQMKRASSQAG